MTDAASAADQTMATLSPVKRALIEIRDLRARLARAEAGNTGPVVPEPVAPELLAPEPLAIVGMGLRFPGGVHDAESFAELLWSGRDAIGPIPADRWPAARYFAEDPDAPGKMTTRAGGFLDGIDQFDADFFGIAPREAASMDPQQRLFLEIAWEALENAGQSPAALAGSRTGVYLGISNSDYGRALLADPDRIDAYAGTGSAYSIVPGRLSYILGLQGPSIAVDTACSSSLVALHLACQALRLGECDLALAGGINLILAPEMNITFTKARMMARDGRCKTFDAAADGYGRGEGCGLLVLRRLSDARARNDRILALLRGSAVNQDGRSQGLTAPRGPAQEAVIRAALAAAGVAPASVGYVETHGTGTPLGDPIEVGALAAVYAPGRDAARPLALGAVKTNIGHLEAAAGVAGVIKAVLSLQRRAVPPNLHFRAGNPRIDWTAWPVILPTRAMALGAGGETCFAGVSSFGFSGCNAHVILEEAPRAAAAPSAQADDRPLHILALSARDPSSLAILAERYDAVLAAEPALADLCYTANTGRAHFAERLAVVGATAADLRQALAGAAGSAQEGDRRPQVAFLFTGQGEAQAGMGLALYETSPVFRDALDACAQGLAPHLQPGLLDALRGTDPWGSIRQTAHAQTALFAMDYALATLWRSWGIEPVAVMGHGIGEYAAACIAGVLPLDDALRLVAAGGRSASLLHTVRFGAPRMAVISAVTGALAGAEIATPDYWQQPGRAPGAVAAPVPALEALGVTHLVEIGPHPVPHGGAAGCMAESSLVRLPALRPGPAPWPDLLDSLRRLYRDGADIDWEGFDRGHRRRRMALPTTPFRRRRHWMESAVPAIPRDQPESGSEIWPRLAAAVARQADQGPLDLNAASYPAKWDCLARLTAAHAIRTLRESGLFARAGERLTLPEVAVRAGIAQGYGRLLRRWLDDLAARGLLNATGDAYVAAAPLPEPDLAALWAEAEALFADNTPLLAYVRHCGNLLGRVLRGAESPLETLFPGGAFTLAEGLYEHSATMRYINGLAAAAVAAACTAVQAGRPARVIEVGAGTGGTAAALLAALPKDRLDYLFTDVSDLFLARARARFGAHPGLRFGLFDLDRDLAEQGYALGSADVIVSANAVHASVDLPAALRRLHDLLAPGGVLVLVESTTHFAWFDMTTGLIEGWQHFADDLRGEQPLLAAPAWTDALRAVGFETAQAWPEDGSAAAHLGQHVVVARVAGVVPASGVLAEGAAASRKSEPAAVADAMRHALRAAPPAERLDLLRDFVRGEVVRVLRCDPSEIPGRQDRLTDLGLDSLMAVQLRGALGRGLALDADLPASLMFDHPTIERLALYLLRRLEPTEPAPASFPPSAPGVDTPGVDTPGVDTPGATDVAAMTDDEVADLLAARLAGRSKREDADVGHGL